MGKFTEFFTSIDNLLSEEKEQKLKVKLASKIKSKIFTEEILEKLNEHDFTGIVDEEQDIVMLFSTIFPVFVKKDGIVFRLYKHKIEVDLSDEMKDRYIYMFSDGRLTSGLFQCFNISDDEYVYGIKRIIEVIPIFKESILETLSTYNKNISANYVNNNLKPRLEVAEKNYNELIKYLED